MVSCLILYHTTITSLTKCKILRAMFHTEDFEIVVGAANMVTIYLWNVGKIDIWQAATDFESTNIITCYGFGERMREAHLQAQFLLGKRVDDVRIIKEAPAVYNVI